MRRGAKSRIVTSREATGGHEQVASLGMGPQLPHAQVDTRTPSMAVVGMPGMLVSLPAERNIE
jgi:hypothetical protein